MKSVRTLAGALAVGVVMTGMLVPTIVNADDEKRGFKPRKLIGKLIPGGRDKENESATVMPASSEQAVVIPDPNNPAVAPVAPMAPPVAPVAPNPGTNSSGERIPPPPVPGGAVPMTNAPVATATAAPSNMAPPVPQTPPANPFGEPEPEKRGLLSGVAGVVGKVIPGGNDDESPVASGPMISEAEDERGFISRIRNRRNQSAGDPNIIPPPTIIPRPVDNPGVVPPPQIPDSTPVGNAPANQQRMTIPLVHSGNPAAPLQREERDPDSVEPTRPSSIDPTMPMSVPANEPGASPFTGSGQPAEVAAQVPSAAAATAQDTSDSITPSVPMSNLTQVPDEARAVTNPPESPGVAAGATNAMPPSSPQAQRTVGSSLASAGLSAANSDREIPPPPVPPAAPQMIGSSPPPAAPVAAAPASTSSGLVISDGGASVSAANQAPSGSNMSAGVGEVAAPEISPAVPSRPAGRSAVEALTGQPAEPAPAPAVPVAPPAAPASAIAPPAVPSTPATPLAPAEPVAISVPPAMTPPASSGVGSAAPAEKAPPATGSTFFVAIREGVNGSARTADGQAVAIPAGTVMRWIEGDESVVTVQLDSGAQASIETWQVRDASFDEAVEFLKKSG